MIELTALEHEIATLVVQGLSNREIARRIYVSPRTLEKRLTRLYARLGVRSRYELAWLASGSSEAGNGGEAPVEALTVRERQVAELAACGWTNAQIAEHLQLSVRTVENHLVACFRKTGIRTRAQLVGSCALMPATPE